MVIFPPPYGISGFGLKFMKMLNIYIWNKLKFKGKRNINKNIVFFRFKTKYEDFVNILWRRR